MMNFWRKICIMLDAGVYWAVEKIFQLIMDLANLEIFSQSVITEFANRIYIILGLVMLFKIIMSFIQMLIDPDKMSDKEKGVRNILTRVVISLGLIVLVPTIFSTARQVQNYIVPVIPRVLLGVTIDPSQNEEADETMASIGRMMAFYSFLPFFNYDNPGCDHGEILGTGTQLGETEEVPEIYSVPSAVAHVNDKCDASTAENSYKYNYRWLLSTLVGAYLVYVLVSVAVAIAIRALKFGICEFIAPIPIASYVDPKTSKQAFDNWVSTSIKTYLDLFIRLIIVYFVVFVFMTVFDNENLSIIYAKLNNDPTRYTLVTLFVIVGLLQFVKQAPKFISDMLGLKGAGDFMGMFKGEGFKQIGSSVGGLAGTIGATVGSGIGNAMYSWKNGERGRAIFRGIGGATSALVRGSVSTISGKGWKGAFSDNIRTTTSNSQRRVNKGAIVRASRNDRREDLLRIDEKIQDTIYQFDVEGRNLSAKKNNLQAVSQSLEEKLINLQNRDVFLQTRLENAKKMGNQDDIDAAEVELEKNRLQLSNLSKNYNAVNDQLNDIDVKINSLATRKNKEIEKLESSKTDVPRVITPVKNTISELFNSLTGMQSVSGSTILKASSDLASIRSTYYTGEAMKKLTEEGSKITEKLSMGATYSEVASAYDALRSGSVQKVNIGGTTYTASEVQTVGELFKKAEKEAAIKYINAVKEGRIKNSTIEEGFKQILGALDGMGIDAKTKGEFIKAFNNSPGDFLKSLSDISKRLETEGKRRQAYEREQKKNN